MYNSEHTDFITAPLLSILRNGFDASKGVADCMEGYPLADYLLESLFIRLTGALEQKLKCICWDIATVDYEYRYEYLNNKNYGECSDYKSKNGIYNDLIDVIKKHDVNFEPSDVLNKSFMDNVLDETNRLFETSVMNDWKNKEYVFYQNNYGSILKENQIGQGKQTGAKSYTLLQSSFKEKYESIVYKHRNRCAHNTLSYQVNKPDLNVIANVDFDYHNYFFRYAMIVVVDSIFISLYKKLIEVLPERY